jgi:formamidopyrimidine-DNA glycosylase
MPELPEVETTRRALAPLVEGRAFTSLEVREPRLRLPVPADLADRLVGRRIRRIERRGKYLLFRTARGALLVHLGMSGSLVVTPRNAPLRKHDHLRFGLAAQRELRFHDPRRFGLCLWLTGEPSLHPLLRDLGPEPLGGGFHAAALHARLRHRKAAVKTLLMDSRVVVGLGNIYAAETLFLAGVRPTRRAGRVSLEEAGRIVTGARQILQEALRAGGTTLRDFRSGSGDPGHFATRLRVYGRMGAPCIRCGLPIRSGVIGQRMSYWCGTCQT